MPPKPALGVKTSVLSYVSTCILKLKPNDAFSRLRGAMVVRLTPDQKAVCSSHVGVKFFPFTFVFRIMKYLIFNEFYMLRMEQNNPHV